MNITTMEALVRTRLNEPSTVMLSSTEILRALNDGQKDVAIKALCIEKEVLVVLDTSQATIPFTGIKINYIGAGRYEPPTIDLSLSVPGVPTVVGGTVVIAETPVTGLGSLAVPGVPSIAVSTAVV